jgi:hypothetical protein
MVEGLHYRGPSKTTIGTIQPTLQSATEERMVKQILLATLAVGVLASPSSPQVPPKCLHGPDERPDHRVRREQALTLAQQINRAENPGPTLAPLQQRTFRPLDQLANLPPTPTDFKVQLTADGATYAFSIKDTYDPCRYAVFSDHEQTIYEATARRGGVSVKPADIP